MPELRLPSTFGFDFITQLRRQFVPVLRRIQALAPYGLQAIDGAEIPFTIPWFKVDTVVITASGATTTTAGLVRPGFTYAVFARNLTLVTGAGVTGYQIGTTVPADPDAWHANHPLAANTLEDTDPWIDTTAFTVSPATANYPAKYDAATDIVLTAIGGTFSGGDIQLIAFTLDFKPTA